MKNKNVVFVYSDNWAGMYVDGVLEYENHSISSGDMFNVLGGHTHGYTFCDEVTADQSWMDQVEYLPSRLEDVKRA